jgi:hypothetical protein
VTIESGSSFIAKGLTVESSLRMEKNTSLAAAPLDKIHLIHGLVVEFASDDVRQLPLLSLGDIGVNYDVLPGNIQLAVGAMAAEGDVHVPLVQGKTLGNCDQWLEKVHGVPAGYVAVCETIVLSDGAQPGDSPLIALVIICQPDNAPIKDNGLGTGVIVGLAIGCLPDDRLRGNCVRDFAYRCWRPGNREGLTGD